jgi:isocitrate dehydrogenase
VKRTIVILEGDQTGQELLEEVLKVIDPAVIGLDFNLVPYDLSLVNRRATDNKVVSEAAAQIREHGLGLKAAAITPPGLDDAGSPNRILREQIQAEVILRTGRRFPVSGRGACQLQLRAPRKAFQPSPNRSPASFS